MAPKSCRGSHSASRRTAESNGAVSCGSRSWSRGHDRPHFLPLSIRPCARVGADAARAAERGAASVPRQATPRPRRKTPTRRGRACRCEGTAVVALDVTWTAATLTAAEGTCAHPDVTSLVYLNRTRFDWTLGGRRMPKPLRVVPRPSARGTPSSPRHRRNPGSGGLGGR